MNYQQGRHRRPPLEIQPSKPPKHVLDEDASQRRHSSNDSTTPTNDPIICIHILNTSHVFYHGPSSQTEYLSHSLMLHPHEDGTYFRIAHAMGTRNGDADSPLAEDGWDLRTIKIK